MHKNADEGGDMYKWKKECEDFGITAAARVRARSSCSRKQRGGGGVGDGGRGDSDIKFIEQNERQTDTVRQRQTGRDKQADTDRHSRVGMNVEKEHRQ
jgi:hypothetical protein